MIHTIPLRTITLYLCPEGERLHRDLLAAIALPDNRENIYHGMRAYFGHTTGDKETPPCPYCCKTINR